MTPRRVKSFDEMLDDAEFINLDYVKPDTKVYTWRITFECCEDDFKEIEECIRSYSAIHRRERAPKIVTDFG